MECDLTSDDVSMTGESFDEDDGGSAAVVGNPPDSHESAPLSLLELSTQAVARHCSCATIEKHALLLLDEQLLRRVCLPCFFSSVTYLLYVDLPLLLQ